MDTGDFVKLLLQRHFPLFCFNSGFSLKLGLKYFWSYVAFLVLYLGLFVFGVICRGKEKKKKRQRFSH